MQSKAATVAEYMAQLPEDRRAAIEAVRAVFRKNMDADIEEGMQYGMIGYYVPHKVFPAGYHCDPKQPLPYAGLASQKGHMSLYMMSLYIAAGAARPEGGADQEKWFRAAWAKTGKKLDMGKACIRFKKLDDLALDVIGEAIRRVPSKKYIADYQTLLARGAAGKGKPAARSAAAKKPVTKSAAVKKVSKPKAAGAKKKAAKRRA